MAEPRESSLPPSEPRPARAGLRELVGSGYDRPARVQMLLALLLGVVLVAIPLYLWRRPRVETPAAAAIADAAAALASISDAGYAPVDAGAPSGVTLSAPSMVECHDPGPRKTPAEQCDHLTTFEQSFARAIEQSAACVPTSAGGGTLPYVADVSFQRKKSPITVSVAKDGRSLRSARAAVLCAAAVKKTLASFDLDPRQHAHTRYKIAITATYAGGQN